MEFIIITILALLVTCIIPWVMIWSLDFNKWQSRYIHTCGYNTDYVFPDGKCICPGCGEYDPQYKKRYGRMSFFGYWIYKE